MALFKILKGNEANLPSTKHEGWAYVTEKGNMYVDLSNDKRVKIGNRADTAEYADKATGDTQTIRSRYLARIKQVTSDGMQFTFRGETGDGTNAPDLISIPLAGDKAGLVSNAAQTIKGEKTFANGIKFPDVTSTTYPAVSAGLTWSGSTDGAKIYYEVQASDKGMLIIEARDDTNAGAIFRNSNSKKEVSIINGLVTGTFKGNLSGIASHATSDANGKNIASYVASVLAQSDNRTIRVTKGDGTTNDVKLYFAASSSFGGAADSANVLNINNTENIGVGRMQFFQKSGDATLMPDTNWWSLVRLQHGGYSSTGYWTEMAYAFHSDTIKFRRNQNGTKSAWKTIAFTDGTIAKATQAEKDWLGQVIDETYMKYPLTISDEKITMTRGDGTNSTITIPDKKVSQGETTTTNYRPIILGATNSTDVSKLSATIREQVYASTKFYAQPSTGTLVATTFKGALDGNAKTATNATYAEKAKGDTISIQSKYVSSVLKKSGSNYVLRISKGDGTYNDVDLYFAASSSCGGDANQAIKTKDLGTHTEAASGTTANAPTTGMLYGSGMYMTRTYNDTNTPCNFGNIINVAGAGTGQLLLGWSGSDNTTGGIYYRSHRDTSTGGWSPWKQVAFTDGKIKNAEFADKATGDTTTIRSTYVKSVAKKSGSNYVFTVSKGDGTTNDVDLYFAASASCGGAALSANILNGHIESNITTRGGDGKLRYSYNITKTATGLFAASNNANAILTINKHNGSYDSQLGFSSDGNIYYRSFNGSALNTTTGWKTIAFTDGKIKNAEFADKATGDSTTIRSTYISTIKAITTSGTTFTFRGYAGDGTERADLISVPMDLVGSEDTNSKIFLVGTTSQSPNAQTGYSHDTVFIDSDGFLYDSGNKPSYHSRVSVGNTNNYKYHRIAKIDTTSNWYDGTILLYISQDYNNGKYGILRLSLRTNEISKGPSASVEAEWIARSGFALTDFKLCLYSATGKAYADLYYISNGTYAGITVKQIQQGARGSLTQGRWILTNSSEDNNTTTSDKKNSSSYKDIAAAQTGLRGGVAYTSTHDTTDASRVNESNWADRALADWNGNKIREKYIATLAVKTSSKTVFAFKGVNMEGSEISAITVPNASASIAGIITAEAQTLAGNKTLNNDLYVKGKVAVSTDTTGGYNLYVNGTSYFVGNMNLKADLVLEARSENRLLFTDANKKVVTGGHYANSVQIGINTTNTTHIDNYNLFVEGTSKFNGNTTHSKAVYFANGTKYYINHEADARLRYVGVGTAAPNNKYALNVGGTTTHAGDVNPEATNTRSLGTSTARWSKLFIGTADTYGSATQPIYWSAGVPKATTYSLKATVNKGSAYRLAYYSTATAISQTGHYANTTQVGINITNTTTIGSNALYVNGTACFSDAVQIQGGHSLSCGPIYCDNVHCNDIDNSGYLHVSGSSTFGMPATFSDGVTMNDTLKINGSLTCNTKVTINGSLNVNNNALLRKIYINGVNTKTGFINWGTPSSAYNSGFTMGGLTGLCISQNGNETSGMQLNGDYIVMWSPADSYCLRYFDEDSGSEIWNINSSGVFSGTAAKANYVSNPRNSNTNMNTWNYGAGTMYFREDSGSTVSNLPSSAWWQTMCQHSPDANYGNQLAQQMTGGTSAYIRSFQSGTWSSWYRLWRQGDAVTSAVWNDYAECRKSDSQEPGYVMFEKGDDTLSKTIERLQHFAGIVSDTWGFSQGETADAKTNIAVAGRVLAYPYRDRNEYKPGDCVCAAPGGKVDIMTREEIVQYPDRIVGTVSCVPEYEEWGGGEGADRDPVKVNGRIWIKVK